MSRSLILIIGIIVVVFVAEIVIYYAVTRINRSRRAKRYIEIMKTCYEQSGVVSALNTVIAEFPARSIERHKCEEAVGYLCCSILKDYKTAFQIVEKGLPQKDVRRMHKKILKEEQHKANITFSLPEQGREGA